MPPQNLVDRTIVDVCALGVKLAHLDASLAARPARDRQIEPEVAAGACTSAKYSGQEGAFVKRRFMVLGTDQGLCGHFTRRLVDEAIAELERLGGRSGPVVCAGHRTRDQILAHGTWSSRVQRAPVSLREVDEAAQELMTLVNESVEEERCDGVRLVYTRHEGSGQGTPRVRKVYPITRADLLGRRLPPYGFYPRLHTSLPEITDHILFEWVYAAVYRSIVESLTAEHDARLRTTDRATRTVDERLEALRLDINRERQHAITEEILDIMSGSAGVSAST